MMSLEKVFCFEGEPFFINYEIENIIEENGNPNIIKLNSNSSAGELKSALTSFPFFDLPDIVIVENPNAELINCCAENIEKMNALLLIITCENNTFDARQSFISKLIKNNKLKFFDYIHIDDSIKSFINNWSVVYNVKLHKTCYDWLDHNSPSKTVKCKINGQKKDIVVHDLLLIEKELSKINSLYQSNNEIVTPENLEKYCNFKRESDIWNFIDNAISGNLQSIFNYFELNKLNSNNEGVLWVMASQIELYFQVKYKSKNLQDDLSLKSYINFYLNEDFTVPEEFKAKSSLNPYRLQMAQQSASKYDLNILIDKYHAIISAIQDLRSGMPGDIVSSYLALALSNKTKYTNPFLNV